VPKRVLIVDDHQPFRAVARELLESAGYLDRLLASVVNDPRRNRREVLLGDIRRWLAHPTGDRGLG